MIANEHIKIVSNSYEKVKTFKYLGSLLINQISIPEEIKCRLKARNSCYSVQTLLSSRRLSKNLKIKIHKTIIFSDVLYGREIWFIILREDCRLRVFKTRILRRIFGSKRDANNECRRLNNEKLCNLYRSPNISYCSQSDYV